MGYSALQELLLLLCVVLTCIVLTSLLLSYACMILTSLELKSSSMCMYSTDFYFHVPVQHLNVPLYAFSLNLNL